MDKEEELKKIAKMYSTSLSDDEALRQEVETELFDHLIEAFEEEARNSTEEKALDNTFKRFGNPEEISCLLIEGNASRLSRNARIRRATKWLLMPLMIVSMLFCLDVRGILASVTLLKTMKSSCFAGKADSNDDGVFGWNVNLKTKKLSEYEQSLFDYYYNGNNGERLEILSRLFAVHRDDAMLCAIFALELSQSGAMMQEKLPEVIANGKRIDPSNALYDYLECLMLLRQGGRLSNNDVFPADRNSNKAHERLDKVIEVYRQGISREILNTYESELLNRIQDMLKIKKDLLGGMQMIDFRGRERLLFLDNVRRIARYVATYCEMLHNEGDNAKAVEILATFRPFLSQFLKQNNIHLIDILRFNRIVKELLDCAKKIGAVDEIDIWQAVMDNTGGRGEKYRMNRSFLFSCGLISGMAEPFSTENTQAQEWAIERRLEAATFDSASIGLACICLLVVIAILGVNVLAMRMGGKGIFLFIMARSSYKRLLINGLLFPALVYFMLTYFIAGKGGPWAILQVIPIVYLCLLWPLYYGYCCKHALKKWINSIVARGHDGFNASRSFNLLCLFVVLLIFWGCILRPIAEFREHHYACMETFVIPWEGVEIAEERKAHKLRKMILEQISVEKTN